ncbi:MAG TPA: DUF2934 domain-containing protein [Methylomirabilota bacterium]|nr:DUF2934 domain-containing protein [Methylomirabilota bacterium]
MELSNQQQQTNHQEIAQLAHQIWEQRGRPDGCDLDHWLEAERQMLSMGKPDREQRSISLQTVQTGGSLAVQTRPNRVTTLASLVPSRASKQTLKPEGKVKKTMPCIAIPDPAVAQTKPTQRAARP